MGLSIAPVQPAGSRVAAATQQSLMPPPIYDGAFVHAAATIRQCRAIGGDFYDYLDTGQEFHVLLGDACGKGTAAALQAAAVQGMLSIEVAADTGVAAVVARVNRMLCRRGVGTRFVTLFYGVMDRHHRLSYCNAGHCRPMLVGRESVQRLSVGGVPPGLFPEAAYEEASLRIETGDTLVVFSDGVSEAARRQIEFGDERILAIVTRHRRGSAQVILDRLMKGVRQFTGGRQRDDMGALVVRYLA